jgi:hypothetical protein
VSDKLCYEIFPGAYDTATILLISGTIAILGGIVNWWVSRTLDKVNSDMIEPQVLEEEHDDTDSDHEHGIELSRSNSGSASSSES